MFMLGVSSCRNYLFEFFCSHVGLPSPAQAPSYTVQQYRQDNVMVTVQWQPPQDNGSAPVVNYTVTVPGLVSHTTTATSAMVTIPYNVEHSVSIVTNNCNGSSSAVMETIPAIGSKMYLQLNAAYFVVPLYTMLRSAHAIMLVMSGI